MLASGGRASAACGWPTGPRSPADVVVCNADAAVLYERLLPPAAGRGRPAAAAAAHPVDGRLRAAARPRRPRARRRRTGCGSRADYDAEFDAIFGRAAGAGRRPDGLRARPRRPRAAPRRRLRGLVRAGQRPAHDPGRGVDWDEPGLRGALRRPRARRAGRARRRRPRPGPLASRCAPPPTSSARTGAPGGAIYGTASHGPRAALLRPANRVPGARALPGRRVGAPRRRAPAGRCCRRRSSPASIGPAGTPAASSGAPRPPAAPARRRRRPSSRPRITRRPAPAGQRRAGRAATAAPSAPPADHDQPGRPFGHGDRARRRACRGLRAGPQVLVQQHQRQPPPRTTHGGRAERQQHAAEQQVADPVGHRVDHRAERAGPAGAQRDRAVEPVEHPGGRRPAARPVRASRPPAAAASAAAQRRAPRPRTARRAGRGRPDRRPAPAPRAASRNQPRTPRRRLAPRRGAPTDPARRRRLGPPASWRQPARASR